MISLEEAKEILGNAVIGPNEIKPYSSELNIKISDKSYKDSEEVPFRKEFLLSPNSKWILIYGLTETKDNLPLNLINLRNHFGIDPSKNEPCFYNQDWYLKESFVETTLEPKWYLISKNISETTRAKDPNVIREEVPSGYSFPSAILTALAFFCFYYTSGGEKLWDSDFIWCSDLDHNEDRIYTGRYTDPAGINKNGFNIHRHLSIKRNYGASFLVDP